MADVFVGPASQDGGESRVVWIYISRVRNTYHHLAKAKVATLTSQSSIHPPPRPSSHSPIIIYLPRGGKMMAPGPDLLPSIALGSNATVVRLNYRLSDQQPYPNPIHDVLAGYDWIKSHLGHGATSPSDSSKPNQARRFGVCGEFIGGSLAAMLALTECHTDVQGISAAVLGNPIADWTSIFPVDENTDANGPAPSQRRSVASGAGSQVNLTLDSILHIRKTIFSGPAKFFDPFASPSLFFCTPAMELPPAANFLSLSDDLASSSSSDYDESLPRGKKRRHRRTYPPSHTNLQLPKIRIEVGKENILHHQGKEFAQLIRKSMNALKLEQHHREQLEKGDEASSEMEKEKEGVEEEEKERTEVLEREGAGLWGEKEADEVGRWLAQRLYN